MKGLILLCFTILYNISILNGQSWTYFSLYATDNQGRLDSITIGQNDAATVGLDPSLGETNIYGTPYNPLDIRITQRDSINFNCLTLTGSASHPLYFTQNIDLKEDYRPMDWSNYWQNETNTFEVHLHAQDYPIILRSNNLSMQGIFVEITLLDTMCVEKEQVYNGFNIDAYQSYTLFIINDNSTPTIVLQYGVIVPTTKIESVSKPWYLLTTPSSSQITISTDSKINGTIGIFSSLGQQVYTRSVQDENQLEIPINHLPNGIYFVNYNDGQTSSTKPFTKH